MPESQPPLSAPAQPQCKDGLFRLPPPGSQQNTDKLDDLVVVVPPAGWLSLWALVALIAFAVFWGFFGKIPRTVDGQGILLRGGKLSAVSSSGAGEVLEILVSPNEKVSPGQTICRIFQPVQLKQIELLERRVQELAARKSEVETQSKNTLDSQLKFLSDQREKIHAAAKNYESQLASLEKVVNAQEQLLAQGLIPLTTLLQSKTQLNTTQINLISAKGQLQQSFTDEDTARSSAKQSTFQAKSDYENESANLAKEKIQLEESSSIRSPFSGTVANINVAIGQTVSNGTSVADLADDSAPILATLFFPAGVAKKISSSMTAQISPETAPVERFGFLVGKVNSVASVPATKGSMMSVLANEEVVGAISSKGPVLQVSATPELDSSSRSGFLWSSSKGPPFAVASGTLCKARVIVDEDRPIEPVIPLLKKLFGIVD